MSSFRILLSNDDTRELYMYSVERDLPEQHSCIEHLIHAIYTQYVILLPPIATSILLKCVLSSIHFKSFKSFSLSVDSTVNTNGKQIMQ